MAELTIIPIGCTLAVSTMISMKTLNKVPMTLAQCNAICILTATISGINYLRFTNDNYSGFICLTATGYSFIIDILTLALITPN